MFSNAIYQFIFLFLMETIKSYMLTSLKPSTRNLFFSFNVNAPRKFHTLNVWKNVLLVRCRILYSFFLLLSYNDNDFQTYYKYLPSEKT